MTAPWRSALPMFAAAFLAAMDDACTVDTNAAGKGTYNPATRQYDGTPANVYTGACLFRVAGEGSATYGEQQIETVDYDVLLPAGTTGLEPDQQVTVTTINAPSGVPLLDGQVLTVRAVNVDTYEARVVLGCTLNRGGGT